MNRKNCLKEAMDVVCGNETTYGAPENSFDEIAQRWGLRFGIEITAKQVALCMIDLKLVREDRGFGKDDNLVDIAGYAACACECREREG